MSNNMFSTECQFNELLSQKFPYGDCVHHIFSIRLLPHFFRFRYYTRIVPFSIFHCVLVVQPKVLLAIDLFCWIQQIRKENKLTPVKFGNLTIQTHIQKNLSFSIGSHSLLTPFPYNRDSNAFKNHETYASGRHMSNYFIQLLPLCALQCTDTCWSLLGGMHFRQRVHKIWF